MGLFLEFPELGPDGTVNEEGFRGFGVTVEEELVGGFMPAGVVVTDMAPDATVVVEELLWPDEPPLAAGTPFILVRMENRSEYFISSGSKGEVH